MNIGEAVPPINFHNNNHPREVKIALTGKMRSGKDTVAKELAKELNRLGFHVNTVAFGDGLKKYAKELFPNEFEGNNKPRDLYQWFGQTMRQRNPNIWIDYTANLIKNKSDILSLTENTHVAHIITDLRQPNEYQWCKDNGFIIFKVECEDDIRLERMKTLNDNFKLEDLNHETETHIDKFSSDFRIDTSFIEEETLKLTIQSFTKVLLNKIKIRGEI